MEAENKGLYTMVGEGALFEGTLTVPHSVRIDGTIKGKLSTQETLTVGSSGVIEAEVKAKNAIIGGVVKGNVVVEDRVELEAKSSLTGDMKTRYLIINEGAVFHGNCAMEGNGKVKV